jgi:hypothetical protein
MKKVLLLLLLITVIIVTGCSNAPTGENIVVKSGFITISIDKLESDFNSRLDNEYSQAQFEKGAADNQYSYYSCFLGKGVKFAVLTAPDATMVYTADLSCDIITNSESAGNLGYYFSKLIYTVAPDITEDEIINIITELDADYPIPGDNNVTMRNNIIYGFKVDEDYTIHFTVTAHKQ